MHPPPTRKSHRRHLPLVRVRALEIQGNCLHAGLRSVFENTYFTFFSDFKKRDYFFERLFFTFFELLHVFSNNGYS